MANITGNIPQDSWYILNYNCFELSTKTETIQIAFLNCY